MDTRDPLHIHVYGPPGVGKSTLAPAIYTELKIRGFRAEMVMEVAKEYLWEGRLAPERQVMVTSEQMHREERLRAHTDIIVTESPALLGPVYALAHQQQSLRQLVLNMTENWSSLSYVVERDLTSTYEQAGRVQNLAESIEKGIQIRQLLDQCGIAYEVLRMPNDPRSVLRFAARICDHVANVQRMREPSRDQSHLPPHEPRLA